MKTRDVKRRITEYFFTNPTAKLRVRQIEREVKVPLPSAIRYAKELEKEEILKSIVTAGVNMYSADRTSSNFLLGKRLHNLRSLFSSGMVDFLTTELNNPAIAVFGSYSKGEDIEDSDVDIYIETKNRKELDFGKFEKKLHRKIQAFRYGNINKVENKNLANNIINGMVINGHIEVFE